MTEGGGKEKEAVNETRGEEVTVCWKQGQESHFLIAVYFCGRLFENSVAGENSFIFCYSSWLPFFFSLPQAFFPLCCFTILCILVTDPVYDPCKEISSSVIVNTSYPTAVQLGIYLKNAKCLSVRWFNAAWDSFISVILFLAVLSVTHSPLYGSPVANKCSTLHDLFSWSQVKRYCSSTVLLAVWDAHVNPKAAH